MPRINKAADTPTTSLAPKGERVRVGGDSATRLDTGFTPFRNAIF